MQRGELAAKAKQWAERASALMPPGQAHGTAWPLVIGIITFIAAYASYYIAGALLAISGVLACCAAGVTVALLVNPSIVEHDKMHEVWEAAEWVCNTLIFLLGGFIGGGHTYDNISVVNATLILVMYAFLLVTRGAMVGLMFPVVSKIGMKMTVPDAIFVTSAGLRGALGE